MTAKQYYQEAASEIAAGKIDDALWIKVGSDNPGVTEAAQRSLYIKARAEELAGRELLTKVRRVATRVCVVAGLVAAITIGGYLGSVRLLMDLAIDSVESKPDFRAKCLRFGRLADLPLRPWAYSDYMVGLGVTRCEFRAWDEARKK